MDPTVQLGDVIDPSLAQEGGRSFTPDARCAIHQHFLALETTSVLIHPLGKVRAPSHQHVRHFSRCTCHSFVARGHKLPDQRLVEVAHVEADRVFALQGFMKFLRRQMFPSHVQWRVPRVETVRNDFCHGEDFQSFQPL